MTYSEPERRLPTRAILAVSKPMPNTGNPRAFEYLLEAIATAMKEVKLDRLQGLARAHYAGVMLEDLEAEIAARRTTLQQRLTPDVRPPS